MTKLIDLNQCLYVGIDPHKDAHVALATNRFEEKLGVFKVPNNLKEIESFLKQIEVLAHQKKSLTTIFGIEGSRGNGELLTQHLIKNNSIVYEVNPVRTHENRRKTISRDKSDLKDAEKIITELTRKLQELPLLTVESESKLPTAINETSLYRDELVREQTAIKNQLHILFHKDNPDYQSLFKTIFSQKALKYWFLRAKYKEKKSTDILERIRAKFMRMKIKRLKEIEKEIKILEEELKLLIAKSKQQLETLRGISTTTAAQILGEIRNISRFKGPDRYVRYCGIAPQEVSSGKKKKFKKSKTGNRRLNSAIYRIALTQIRTDPKVKEYFLKKIAEGKTKRHAITCIMRRIAVIIYGMLRTKGAYIQSGN